MDSNADVEMLNVGPTIFVRYEFIKVGMIIIQNSHVGSFTLTSLTYKVSRLIEELQYSARSTGLSP